MKRSKRWFSFLLSLAMVIGLIATEPLAAAAEGEPVEMTLSLVGNPKPNESYWEITLETTQVVPGTDWVTSYNDLEVYVNQNRVYPNIVKAGDNRLGFALVPPQYSVIPEFGTTITIKGTSKGSGVEESIRITKELVLEWDGSKLAEYVEGTTATVTGLHSANSDITRNSTHINLNVSGNMPVDKWESISGFTGILNNEVYDVNVFNNYGYLLIELWAYTTPQPGDTFTLKKGIGTKESGNIKISEDFTLVYDGTQWVQKYTDTTLSYASHSKNITGNYWEIYLNATKELPGTDWKTQYQNLEVQVNGEKVEAALTKADTTKKQMGLILYGTQCPLTPEFGTTITIKAGESNGYTEGNEECQVVHITEDLVLEWDGSTWAKYVEGTTVTVTGLFDANSDIDKNDTRFNLNVSGNMPVDKWESISGFTGILNNEVYDVNVFNDHGYLLIQLWAYTTPQPGDTFTLKKGIGTKESGNIKISEDYTLVYTGTTWEPAVTVVEYTSEQFNTYDKVTPPTKEKYVFAGWFTDSTCAAPFMEITAAGNVWAKFVHEDVLTVKAQSRKYEETTESATVTYGDIRFVATVDSLDYKEVGFKITVGNSSKFKEKSSTTVYSSLYGVGRNSDEIITYVPSEEFSPVSKYFNTYSFFKLPESNFDTEFKVQPYWVTLDGTKVYGKVETKIPSTGFTS